MSINNLNFSSIEQMQAQYLGMKSPIQSQGSQNEPSFHKLLTERMGKDKDVRFSKHANERLASRNIHLSTEQITRLQEGIMKADQKGVRDSLMLLDNVALVVNIPNKTVITAVGKEDAVDNVFTNIDGALIV